MTMFDVTDPKQLRKAVKALAKQCAIIEAAHARVGVPEWRTRQGGYAGLARIIAYQQLSTKAAGTIWGRVEVLLGKITPASVLAADIDGLRACGLSRPKIAHIRSIAEAVTEGSLNLRRVAKASDAAAQAMMTQVKGIAPWTAEIYLLFCAGHADIFPAGDLALQEAARMLLGLENRPGDKELRALAQTWSPWRGVASRLLWAYYAVQKQGRDGAPV